MNLENKTTDWNPDLYNDKHAFVYNYGEALVTLLNPSNEERILDLGCGSGQLTAAIAKQAKEVVGIDNSPEMIADAQQKFPDIEFQVANAAAFSFNKPFDSIFSNATLHWVLEYKKAIACMYNNLKPNGKLVLEFGGKGNVQTIVKQLRISLAKRNYMEQSALKMWFFPTIGEYTSALEEVGFRVLMAQHFDRPTLLADEHTGIIDWITMFGSRFFEGVSTEDENSIKHEVQNAIKDKCLINGKWYADYKRIRIIAKKEV